MKSISFIHAADLHLDSPFKGLAQIPSTIFQDVRESTFRALDRLIDLAIRKNVDFVLLVGDLFDQEKQSLKAQVKLRMAFEKLQEHGIPIYLSYGNHDHINGNSYTVKYPGNVHIFNSEAVEYFTYCRDGVEIARIYGFSYVDRVIRENKISEFKATECDKIPYHIAMLHGGVRKNTDEDVYAPFTVSEMKQKDFTYWALGHIHERMHLLENPYIVYPGNIQGRHIQEQGAKGCYYVTMDRLDTDLTFQRLDEIEYKKIDLDISDCEEIYLIEQKIKDHLQEQCDRKTLIELTLKSTNALHLEFESAYVFDEIIELVNDSFETVNHWFYVFKANLAFSNVIDEEVIKEGEHFAGELLRLAETEEIHTYFDELLNHREARKYINTLKTEELDEIKDAAKRLLLEELL